MPPSEPEQSRLEHFPVAFFAMTMGLSGLTLVWQKAAEVLGTSIFIAHGLLILTGVVFIGLAAAYIGKALRHQDALRAEFNHPVKLSFFPTISISLVLLGTALRHIAPELGHMLWGLGAIAHLLLTLVIINRWIHHPQFEINHINPAWFIPAVGNILVPIAGSHYGYIAASWFFFSIGVVFWVVLLTIVFYRIIFHDPLPQRLLPTLFILVAPPAAGFIAYMALNGELDTFGRIQINIALFFTLLLLIQFKRFAALPFFLSFWAYSFPLAAMTIAMMVYHQLAAAAWTAPLSLLLLTLTTLVISWLLVLTLRAAKAGEICRPEG